MKTDDEITMEINREYMQRYGDCSITRTKKLKFLETINDLLSQKDPTGIVKVDYHTLNHLKQLIII